jgi:glycosyltransferase involved in cell wall biosynthesis
MKTLFISHVGNPGGAEYDMMSLCRAMPDTSVLLLEHGPLRETLQSQGIECDVLPLPARVQSVRRSGSLLGSLKVAPAVIGMLWKLAQKLKEYDVIVPYSQKAFVLTVLARVFVRRPTIWFMNDLISAEHFSGHLAKAMVWLANHNAQHVVVNSQASRDAWIAAGGNAERCSISYSGIDSSRIANIDKEKVAAHRTEFSKKAKFVGVMVGRLASWKGQHIVLQALVGLPDVCIVFLGEALFGEQEYKQQLLDYIERHGLQDRALLLGHREDVLEVMASADVVIHSSTAPEPFGRVIVEGMMVGKPVIAANAGGPREIIENECSGLLTEPGEPAELRKAIRRLIVDRTFAHKIAMAGKQRAHELFDVNEKVSQFLAIRNQCVNS